MQLQNALSNSAWLSTHCAGWHTQRSMQVRIK